MPRTKSAKLSPLAKKRELPRFRAVKEGRAWAVECDKNGSWRSILGGLDLTDLRKQAERLKARGVRVEGLA